MLTADLKAVAGMPRGDFGGISYELQAQYLTVVAAINYCDYLSY